MSISSNHTAKRRTLLKAGLLLGTLGSVAVAPAYAKSPIYTSYLSNKAISGYDAVSYFQEGGPVEGSKKFQMEYKGADWLFSNADNLALFKDDPEKYAPQYGGYCAYAVAIGSTAKGDPLQWHVQDDKLFLNVNKSIKTKWLGDKENYIKKADDNWPKVLN